MTRELQQLAAPWFYTFSGSNSDLTDFAWSVATAEAKNFAVRTLRGTKMRTLTSLFDEMAAAFQFPDYFGENWDALDECLADLSWLPAAGYVACIYDSTDILLREDSRQFSTFIKILSKVAREWSEPIERGEAWDRPGKPFHIVLQVPLKDVVKLQKRIEQTGESVHVIVAR